MQRKNILFMMMGVWLGLSFTSSYAQSDVAGTWVKPCSYDPIPGEKKPNYSTITATLQNHHIDIEVNYFTDSACHSPWKLMPTFLQSGVSVQMMQVSRRRSKAKKGWLSLFMCISHTMITMQGFKEGEILRSILSIFQKPISTETADFSRCTKLWQSRRHVLQKRSIYKKTIRKYV